MSAMRDRCCIRLKEGRRMSTFSGSYLARLFCVFFNNFIFQLTLFGKITLNVLNKFEKIVFPQKLEIAFRYGALRQEIFRGFKIKIAKTKFLQLFFWDSFEILDLLLSWGIVLARFLRNRLTFISIINLFDVLNSLHLLGKTSNLFDLVSVEIEQIVAHFFEMLFG